MFRHLRARGAESSLDPRQLTVCGVAGLIAARDAAAEGLASRVAAMCGALTHRGPDDAGSWIDGAAGVALGHRRLSIVDLTAGGHQPMTSPSGRYILTFNGEIYNFRALREQLERLGQRFQSRSDTEVLAAALDRWGVLATCRRLNGMFAFAAWDRRDGCLQLARDRIGEKPLYYGWHGTEFAFASQLDALRAGGHGTGDLDREAIAMYLRYGYVPAPHSIYADVKKLTPGCVLTVHPRRRDSTLTRYWSLSEEAEAGIQSRSRNDNRVAMVDELERLLLDSVRLRMDVDVPFGAFLSGGVDSSTVVALMQSVADRPVSTFSVGFHEPDFNEAGDAAAVASHLGTDHHEIYVSSSDALEAVPGMATTFDEPFSDPSQIPMMLVSRLASREVKVALSGDGGDELFAGYDRYEWAVRIWTILRYLPQPLRVFANDIIQRGSGDTYAGAVRTAQRLGFFSHADARQVGDRVLKLGMLATAPDLRSLYHSIVSFWSSPPVYGLAGPDSVAERMAVLPSGQLSQDPMLYFDMTTYLPDDILVKLDRSTMANSLEGRVPMLDPRVVAAAWRMPEAVKRYDGRGKWPLRQVMARYLPQALTDRPKRGFGLPVSAWLRGPLRPWADALLAPADSRAAEYIDIHVVSRQWSEHKSGTRNWHFQIWAVLMFESWLRSHPDRSDTAAAAQL